MEYAYRLIGLTLYYILLAKSLSCLDRQITNRNLAEFLCWAHIEETCLENQENLPNGSLFSVNSSRV